MLLQMALFHSFYRPRNIPLCIYIYCIFIHLSVNEHLSCFHVLDILNSAAVKVGGAYIFSNCVFSGYVLRSGTAWSYDSSVFSFLQNLHIVLHGKIKIFNKGCWNNWISTCKKVNLDLSLIYYIKIDSSYPRTICKT